MRKNTYLLFPLLALLALSACETGGNIRQTLGMSRSAPDEFKVVARPPLSLPPDYTLRPPRAGASKFNSAPASQQARAATTGLSALAGGNAPTAIAPISSASIGSAAESALMQKLGTAQANPDIREALYQDQQHIKQEDDDRWFGPLLPDDDEELVDASAEAERIQEKQQAGEDITGEDVRTREGKVRSVIDQLF